jgi:hypothetical protein
MLLRSDLVDVHYLVIEFAVKLVKVTHTNFPEVTWMVLVEEDIAVMHTSDVTTTSGMLAVFSNMTLSDTDVAALLPILLESGCHCCVLCCYLFLVSPQKRIFHLHLKKRNSLCPIWSPGLEIFQLEKEFDKE